MEIILIMVDVKRRIVFSSLLLCMIFLTYLPHGSFGQSPKTISMVGGVVNRLNSEQSKQVEHPSFDGSIFLNWTIEQINPSLNPSIILGLRYSKFITDKIPYYPQGKDIESTNYGFESGYVEIGIANTSYFYNGKFSVLYGLIYDYTVFSNLYRTWNYFIEDPNIFGGGTLVFPPGMFRTNGVGINVTLNFQLTQKIAMAMNSRYMLSKYRIPKLPNSHPYDEATKGNLYSIGMGISYRLN